MLISNAIEQFRSLFNEFSERFSSIGLRTQIEIDTNNEDGEICSHDSETAAELMAAIYIGSEYMSDDDMLGYFSLLDINKGVTVSKDELSKEILRLKNDLNDLYEKLLSANDKAQLIIEEAEKADKEAEAALKEFESNIERLNLIGKFAAFGLLGVIVVLAIILAIL